MNHAEQEKLFTFNKELRRAGTALYNYLLLKRRLAKLRERYAMNNKGMGGSDAHRGR